MIFGARSASTMALLTLMACEGVASAAFAKSPVDSAKRVVATYEIDLAGVNFGSYSVTTTRNGLNYTVNSNAKLSAFFGAFKWRGQARSVGRLTPKGPEPTRYTYTARKNKKRPKTVTVTMAKRQATAIKLNPPRNLKKGRVLVRPEHKTNIIDPMSALVALSAPLNGNPCKQSVRVFDGIHRFDVNLSPKTKKRVEFNGKGFARTAHVCRVTYKPIAGHKTGKKYSYISNPKGAEVWMVKGYGSNVFMPYRIYIPTIVGSAVMQVETVKVTLADNRQIALAH